MKFLNKGAVFLFKTRVGTKKVANSPPGAKNQPSTPGDTLQFNGTHRDTLQCTWTHGDTLQCICTHRDYTALQLVHWDTQGHTTLHWESQSGTHRDTLQYRDTHWREVLGKYLDFTILAFQNICILNRVGLVRMMLMAYCFRKSKRRRGQRGRGDVSGKDCT